MDVPGKQFIPDWQTVVKAVVVTIIIFGIADALGFSEWLLTPYSKAKAKLVKNPNGA